MTLQELHNRLYSTEKQINTEDFIKLCDANIHLFSSADKSDPEQYDMVMQITSDYGIQLSLNKDIKNALPQLEKAIRLFEEFPPYSGKNLFSLEYYETIYFAKARILYGLNKNIESREMFQNLYNEFPDKELYINWLKALNSKKYMKYFYAGVILIMLTMVFGDILNRFFKINENIQIWVLMGLVVISFTFLIISLIIKRKSKR